MKKALIIGAGQIGRGFLGEVLYEAGYQLVFLDVSRELVDRINARRSYQIFILGDEAHPLEIRDVRARDSTEEGAALEFVDADIAVTACGPKNLARVAPMIAQGLRLRRLAGNANAMDIIACENMSDGTSALFGFVDALMDDSDRAFCREHVGFPNCEVSRIVVPTQGLPELAVKVEKYMEWIVDRTRVRGDLTGIHNLKLSVSVEAYVARKIFSLNGHAMLGYLGYNAGHTCIWEAVYDYGIFNEVYGALKECAAGWSAKYSLSEDEFMDYAVLMLIRFADQRVSDPCSRPARDPIRKLSLSERFFLPALTALENGVFPVHILRGVSAVCAYDNPEDVEAVRLQALIAEKGVAGALSELTGLEAKHPLISHFA